MRTQMAEHTHTNAGLPDSHIHTEAVLIKLWLVNVLNEIIYAVFCTGNKFHQGEK